MSFVREKGKKQAMKRRKKGAKGRERNLTGFHAK
jgi:hypothetical protein